MEWIPTCQHNFQLLNYKLPKGKGSSQETNNKFCSVERKLRHHEHSNVVWKVVYTAYINGYLKNGIIWEFVPT